MCSAMQPHKDRVALITGSSRGLGREVALQLAAQGASVVVNYHIDEEGGLETERLIREKNGSVLRVAADVSRPDEVDLLFDTILERLGRVDILVNNVGYPVTKLLQQSTLEDWEGLIATNLRSAFLCSKRVLPVMRGKRWGRIINIGSAAGMLGGVGQVMYSASKAGLIGLTRSTAREAISFGVTVNLVAPGFMSWEIGRPTKISFQAQRRLIPMGRLVEYSEVAALVVFLTSDPAGYMTGQQLFIDGGLSMSS